MRRLHKWPRSNPLSAHITAHLTNPETLHHRPLTHKTQLCGHKRNGRSSTVGVPLVGREALADATPQKRGCACSAAMRGNELDKVKTHQCKARWSHIGHQSLASSHLQSETQDQRHQLTNGNPIASSTPWHQAPSLLGVSGKTPCSTHLHHFIHFFKLLQQWSSNPILFSKKNSGINWCRLHLNVALDFTEHSQHSRLINSGQTGDVEARPTDPGSTYLQPNVTSAERPEEKHLPHP